MLEWDGNQGQILFSTRFSQGSSQHKNKPAQTDAYKIDIPTSLRTSPPPRFLFSTCSKRQICLPSNRRCEGRDLFASEVEDAALWLVFPTEVGEAHHTVYHMLHLMLPSQCSQSQNRTPNHALASDPNAVDSGRCEDEQAFLENGSRP